jgi:CheY-like chemotaxis protein
MNSSQPVLYAEDDEDDVFLMERAFRLAAVDNPLRIVPDGAAAVEFLAAATGEGAGNEAMPCLLLLDLKMPGQSGFDVIKWARAQPATRSLPIVVITSSNQESDIQDAYRLGANGYVIKPGRPDELLAMVKGIKNYWLRSVTEASDTPRSSAPPASDG